MTIVRANVAPYSIKLQKKIGRPDVSPMPDFFGIYQQRRCRSGRETIKMKFYKPTNPRTPPQQAHRQKFADAMQQWRDLTPEMRAWYNQEANEMKMHGVNLFIRNYLLNLQGRE